jgi:hypothetical protein
MFRPLALFVLNIRNSGQRVSRTLVEADMARKSRGSTGDSSDPVLRGKHPPLPTAPSLDGGDHDALLSIALALGAVLVFILIFYMAS